MQRLAVALACWFFLSTSLMAEMRKFPYEAVVRADNVTVRCGQGKNYYATARLQKGTVLMVHRHDPGGWYMVSPPEGSFSWIAAEYVNVDSPGTGTVVLPEGDTKGAPIWVGSEITSDHSVRQRTLQAGDTVQILAEDVFQDNTGSTRVFKIAPPLREFRWVKGDFVIPRNESLQREALNDPYSNPIVQAAEVEQAEEEDDVAETEASAEKNTSTSEAPSLQLVDRQPSQTATADVNDPKAALREIDHHYTEMIELDPAQWDIEELVRSYEGLAASAPQLAGQVRQRLAALEDRRKLHAEYRSFAQLSSQTTQRDQELASQGKFAQADMVMEYDLGDQAPLPTPVQVVSTEPNAPPVTNPILPSAPSTKPSPVLPRQPAAITPQLNGAGIVQRLPNGRYGIVAPEGRLLAVLQADGNIPLNRVVGQSMGFIGERSFDPRLGTDLLIVKQMVPIQLRR